MKRGKTVMFAVCFVALLAVCVLLTERTRDSLPPETIPISPEQLVSEIIITESENSLTEQQNAEATSKETTQAEESASVNSPVTVESTTRMREPGSDDVTLNVELPSANGEIYVDTHPDNEFIALVVDERHLDEANLVAVFSLPDTGQNYVLEFDSAAQNRNADSLNRVFLIVNGEIVSVCSSDSDLCENVTSVENWFCMNVILKRMILPAIEDRLK